MENLVELNEKELREVEGGNSVVLRWIVTFVVTEALVNYENNLKAISDGFNYGYSFGDNQEK